jgi:hypothetical protein
MGMDTKLKRLFDMVDRVCGELEAKVPPQTETVDEMKALVSELRVRLREPRRES